MNLSKTILLFALLLGGRLSYGQGTVSYGTVHEGDTIPYVMLRSVYVIPPKTFTSKRERKQYERLVKKVKKVYPMAKTAKALLNEYATQIDSVETRKQEKKFYKMVEKELVAEYQDDIKDMTMSEGRILIKLIDRETSDTSYELIQELRSKFTAFFWQGLARVFGQDLKSQYDPEGADREIEMIVLQIEAGLI